MEEAIEIVVDTRACRGAGECALRASEIFALGEDDRAHVLALPGSQAELHTALVAARSCPHFAISVKASGRELT